MLWTPPPTQFHCPDCAVEWFAVVREPCWLCGGESEEGGYKDTERTYPMTTSMAWPNPKLDEDRTAL